MPDEPNAEEIKAHDSVLYRAESLIYGDRNETYGHPLDDFATTAEFWTTWGHARGFLKPEAAYSPEDVAMMQVFVKQSRESRVHGLDNIIDGPGYFGCLGRVIAERLRRGLGAAYTALTKRP